MTYFIAHNASMTILQFLFRSSNLQNAIMIIWPQLYFGCILGSFLLRNPLTLQPKGCLPIYVIG